MTQKTKGALLTVLAAISWGISGISGEYLMQHGMAVNHLTCLRLLIAGTFLTFLAAFIDSKQFRTILTDKRALMGVFLFAILGLALNQFAYLLAISYTNAGTATVLQYMTPVLVLAYTSFKERVLPTPGDFLAMVLAVIGVVLLATHGDLTSLAISPIGLFWGLFSAITYSFYILIPVKLIKAFGSLPVIGLGMLMGGVSFSLFTQPWQYHFDYSGMNLVALFGIVGIGTIFAYTLFLKGVTLVGAVNASLIASLEPVAAVFFSIILMKARFFPMDLLAVVLILSAVFLITLKDFKILSFKK